MTDGFLLTKWLLAGDQWLSQFRGSLPGFAMKGTGWELHEPRPNQSMESTASRRYI
jgi:hypothetical protein